MSNVAKATVFVSCLVLGSFAQGQVPANVQDDGPDIGIVRQETCPADKADTLIVYSATWCVPCQASKPQWVLLRSQGYKVVYINIDHPHKHDGDWEYQTPEIVDKAIAKRPRVVPTLRYYNSHTGAFLKHELTGRQRLDKIKEALWKPSSSTDLVPEQQR